MGGKNGVAGELRSRIAEEGFSCYLACSGEEATRQAARQAPDLVLFEADGRTSLPELYRGNKPRKNPPVIALVSPGFLDHVNGHLDDVDDFVLLPGNLRELELRIKRLLCQNTQGDSDQVITCGDLVIDLDRCQVTLASKRIEVTFREYELLRFLAGHRGRVYTREALLNRVWGYDYYGGDRTVDVHIRRLRSKIEDSGHTFIETVRNIGYRFRDGRPRNINLTHP